MERRRTFRRGTLAPLRGLLGRSKWLLGKFALFHRHCSDLSRSRAACARAGGDERNLVLPSHTQTFGHGRIHSHRATVTERGAYAPRDGVPADNAIAYRDTVPVVCCQAKPR